MIPKTAHFYWGAGPMSFLRRMTLDSFRLHNPDWRVVLHIGRGAAAPSWKTRERQDATAYQGKDWMPTDADGIEFCDYDARGMSDVHAKDVLNWEILATEGGVVADMDILWTRPLDALQLHGDACLVEFKGNPKAGYIPVTFMASSGQSPMFGNIWHNARACYSPDVYESCGTPRIGGSIEFLRECYPETEIQRLPDCTVFPFYHLDYSRAINATHGIGGRREAWDPGAVGIHWYGGTPASQKVNCSMTPENLHTFRSPLAEEVKKCLAHSNR